MPTEWKHLRNETAAAQLSFLDTELKTGMTFARLALKARDANKVARNLVNARKAYDTIIAYLADLPAETPGLDGIQERLKTLQQMIQSLEK
ncbi:MAG TPA: hypothetical protein VET69_07725 [Terriglobales bacterium]|jgi:hypothetical protein|nr:hypothetical protein [Terriglobales bacterium]